MGFRDPPRVLCSNRGVNKVQIANEKKRARTEFVQGWLLLAPAFIIMLVFTVYPVVRSLVLSFTKYNMGMAMPEFMQWANVCAATTIIIAPLMIAFLFMQKQFMNSIVSAGVKE